MKSITLKYENSKVVNFTALKSTILVVSKPQDVQNPKKVRRKHGGVEVSETNKYTAVINKHGFMTSFE